MSSPVTGQLTYSGSGEPSGPEVTQQVEHSHNSTLKLADLNVHIRPSLPGSRGCVLGLVHRGRSPGDMEKNADTGHRNACTTITHMLKP